MNKGWGVGPGRTVSDGDLGRFLQEGLWCESFWFLTSSCHLVSVVLKVGRLGITWRAHLKMPIRNLSQWWGSGASSDKSRNTPSQQASRYFRAWAWRHTVSRPRAIHRVRKEAILLEDELSPSILCLALTTHPELYNGPTDSLLSSHSLLFSVHPSIHSFILSTCTRYYWSWRDRSTIKMFRILTSSNLLSSAKVTVIWEGPENVHALLIPLLIKADGTACLSTSWSLASEQIRTPLTSLHASSTRSKWHSNKAESWIYRDTPYNHCVCVCVCGLSLC